MLEALLEFECSAAPFQDPPNIVDFELTFVNLDVPPAAGEPVQSVAQDQS